MNYDLHNWRIYKEEDLSLKKCFNSIHILINTLQNWRIYTQEDLFEKNFMRLIRTLINTLHN